MYKLKEDIRGVVNPSTLYGKAGEEITKVSELGNTWIVESKSGSRFPVNKSRVVTSDEEIKVSKPVEEKPVEETPKQTSNPVKRKSSAKPSNQKSLF